MKYLFAFINGLGYLNALLCAGVMLAYYWAPDALWDQLCAERKLIDESIFYLFFAWLCLKPLHSIADCMGRYLDALNAAEAGGTQPNSDFGFAMSYIWHQHLLWRIPLVLILLVLMGAVSSDMLTLELLDTQ